MKENMRASKSLAVDQAMLDACARSGDSSVTPMQLIKLVYVAHGYMLGRHGRPLLDESVFAWQYGPVVPSVYHAVKRFNSSPVTAVPGVRPLSLDPEEAAVIAEVATTYGRYDAIVLSAATHKAGTPWQKTWEAFGKNAPISNDLIEGFYASILKQPRHSSL